MKLLKFTIKNFRGLKGDKNTITFKDSNLIFLIGQNNVGKSTFLHAYDFFINSKQKAELEDFYNYDTTNPIEIEAEFLKEDADTEDATLNKEADWVAKWVDSNQKIKIKKVWKSAGKTFDKYTFNPNPEINDYEKDGFGGLHTYITKYAPTPILINAIETEESFEKKVNEIIDKEYLKKITTLYEEDYNKAVTAISSLQNKIVGSDNIDEYNTRINKNFKEVFPEFELKISQKKEDNIDVIKAFKANHSIAVQKEGVNRKENFSQHGHGIIRQALFNFIAFLKHESTSSRKDYLILFEEPELYMHPKAIFLLRQKLYEIAENSPFQILCATHSPGMIDISKPHSSLVRIAKNPETEETKTYQVGHSIFQADENKDFVQMINRFNPNVCETFYTNEVVLVEGDTEALICREILKKNFPSNDIFVLNTGSKNNIPFFQEILTHFNIKQHIIHDSDTRYLYDINETGEYIRRKNNDDSDRKNSAWSLNETIWDNIVEANRREDKLAQRYVSIYDFESVNGYVYDKSKGKPLSAYEFAKPLDTSSTTSIMEFIKQIVGDKTIDKVYSMSELNTLVKEPDE